MLAYCHRMALLFLILYFLINPYFLFPPKVEKDVNAENEVRNIPEPYHADEKDSEHKGEKDDQPVGTYG